jgi:putative transposase
MPWSQTSPMDPKTQFIADYLRDRLSVAELCELYGVSPKTGYKWIDRYLIHGPQGLEEQSRRPSTSPRHTPDHVVAAILEARRRQPSWGAKKLLSILRKRHARRPWPARSTVCDILSRNGLVPKKRKRRVIGHPGKPTSHIDAPHDVWSADFKGHFKTEDGRYCYPLTITDGYSRFLLSCQALSSTSVAEAQPVFTRVFKEFGLPQRIRTDNGVPFATNTLARLSQWSAWWVRRSSTTAAKSSTMSGRMRRSTCGHPPHAMHPPHGQCPTNCHRWSIPTASRCATSVPTVASGGTVDGSTSPSPVLGKMSASTKSTMASGMSTSGPSNSVG